MGKKGALKTPESTYLANLLILLCSTPIFLEYYILADLHKNRLLHMCWSQVCATEQQLSEVN